VNSDQWPTSLELDRPESEKKSAGQGGPALRAVDGTLLATRCWISSEPADAIVVISHGLTATKDDPKVVALAARLHEIGYDVVAYDSRGHGQSGGFCTLGKHEVQDVAALVEWVRSRTRRVVLVGASMGAVGVLSYAAKDSALTGVVAVSSPGAWRLPLRVQSLITAGLARTAPGRHWARRKMNVRIAPWGSPEPAYVHLGSVQCPVVVIHGEQDPIIPWNSSLAKEVVEGPRRELIVVPTMGHAFDPVSLGWICGATVRLVRESVAADTEASSSESETDQAPIRERANAD
jgi:alpha-beta hydrolase superfamily lysophospholipase